MAANSGNGHVYLGDQVNRRIDEFNAFGQFIRAWGWGVDTGAAEFEVCTAASECQPGLSGGGAGQFSAPLGVALDSVGDIYVTDFSNRRVEKFGPQGNFLLSFGESGSGNGQFGVWGIGDVIAIDSSDHVYVGDRERIQRFDTDGIYQSQCSLPAGVTVQSLATDSSGSLYAAYELMQGVRKLSFVAGGECQEVRRFDIPGPDEFTDPRPTAVTVDGAGNVYAFSDPPAGNFSLPRDRIFEFDATGKVIDQFGKAEFGVSTGMATNLCAGSEAPGNLYVSNGVSGTGPPKSNEAFFRAYGTEPVGCFKARTLPASAITEDSATLNGTVNPSGVAVSECRFEYGTSTDYGSQASCVPAALGEGNQPVAVHADLSGLEKGTIYHFRLVAKVGTEVETGVDEEFKTLGPPVISTEQTISVTDSEARLGGRVNPEGFATSYRFEYTEAAAFEVHGFEGAHSTPEIAVGSDRSAHAVAADISGLASDATYHWRIVAENLSGVTEGKGHSFTTYRPFAAEGGCPNQALRSGASAFLPDCRAYEMVSPVDKNGADIVLPGEETGNVRSTADGNKLTYTTMSAFGDQANASAVNQYIASREGGGWANHGIHPAVHGEALGVFGLVREFMTFTPDLCEAWLIDNQTPPPTADGQLGRENLYRRDNCDPGEGALEALIPAPPALPVSTKAFYVKNTSVQGISEDGSQALFVAEAPLPQVPEAAAGENAQIYDRFGGELVLASVLPDSASGDPAPGDGSGFAAPGDNAVGSGWNNDLRHAVSADGSRVYWTAGGQSGTIYLRHHPEQGIVADECTNAQKACTVPVSGTNGSAHFWGATPDGTKALYSEPNGLNLELLMFEEGEEKHQVAKDITGVVAMSEDLSRVYFVSRSKLGPEQNERGEEAVKGKPNIYLSNNSTLSFIGTLTEGDVGQLAPDAEKFAYALDSVNSISRSARASVNGGRLAFESQAPLTGFDNTAQDGEAAVEVFLYDAESGRLLCVSCNPSGARPQTDELLAPYERKINVAVTNVQAAAWIPAWEQALYPSNVLAASGGRLFFNSNDALLPRDTNGAQDVYEWEEAGVGGCREVSPSYFPQNGGCLSLISSGENPSDSEFWEASADGSDVFFSTESSLLPQDPGLVDLYDARVGGGFAQPSHTAACEGEACQSPPPPPSDATPASAAFRGPGNVSEASRPSRCHRKSHKGHKKTGKRAHKAHRLGKGTKKCGRQANSTRRAGR